MPPETNPRQAFERLFATTDSGLTAEARARREAPGALDALLEAAGRWPRAGALGPLIREPDGSTYPSGRALPSGIRRAPRTVPALLGGKQKA